MITENNKENIYECDPLTTKLNEANVKYVEAKVRLLEAKTELLLAQAESVKRNIFPI
jgi:hypothetical protein